MPSRSNQLEQGIPPAPQHPTADGDFRCGICNKTYSRRDLRDRHRRRCIKTVGQERQSKRKSCETCAQKKLRCSMTRPSCSRCLQMRTPCQYPPSAVPVNLPQPDNLHNSAATSSSLSSVTPPSAATQPSLPGDLSHEPVVTRFDELTPTSWDAFGPGIDPMANVFPDTTMFAPQDLMSMGQMPWNDDFSTFSHSIGQNGGLIGSLGSQSHESPAALLAARDEPKSMFTPQPLPIHALSGPPEGVFTNGMDYANSDECSYSYDSETGKNLYFARNFYPLTGPLTPYGLQNTYQDLVALMREYPSLILQRDFWSPFIHHGLYRCSIGGMAEPLGVALACVSAHAGSVESNYGFVDRMVNQEREKLVRNFQSHLHTPETCLAALHAVCVYQILGLFGDTFPPAAVLQPHGLSESNHHRREECERQAELHGSFLLKMTRRLYKQHRPHLLAPHLDETDWERWKFTESLRRNLFLVHMVNILGARARKLNEDYFEPLDDEMIDLLPLPGPECMWRACSAGEWRTAKELCFQPSPTPRGEGNTFLSARTLRELRGLEESGGLDVETLVVPLTRMALGCGKI